MTTVIFSERYRSPMPIHVCVDGHPELWEQGYTHAEALRRLKDTHGVTADHVRQRGRVTQDLRDWPEVTK